MKPPPNGLSNGLLTKWALGLLAAGILGLSGWGGKTLVRHGEQIAQSETQFGSIAARLARMETWNERVEEKLDRLLKQR